MDVFNGLLPSDSSSLNINNVDLSALFASQIPSYNSICDNQMWSHPSTYVQECELKHNVSSCNNTFPVTSNSIPSASCIDNQWNLLGHGSFYSNGGSFDNQSLDSLFHEPSNLQGLEGFNSTDISKYFVQEYHTDDDILQWVSENFDAGLDSTLNDDLWKSLVADLPAISSQSCVTDLVSGKGRSSDSPSSNNNLLTDGFGMHSGNDRREECLESIIMAPMVDSMNTSAMECVSEVEGSTTVVPKKGLFSELGLDQLLSTRAGSNSSARSSYKDQFSAPKRQKVDYFPAIGNHTPLRSHSEVTTAQPKRAEESSKVTKKRARPGESTRPRPKDRQMIQDRIKELREIIPNGAKCSIDSLLDRTIKHMLFMQGVTKYVDKLKQVDELKARRDNNNAGVSGSAAWAIEVGGQNPIVVEDLGHSHQMLIEMLCQEQGFFLEIADVIRGFGLTILKGVVEARDDKMWAHFIVEANRHVTRMEVLMSLLQLLQDTSTSGSKTISDQNKVLDNNPSSLLNNYHNQPIMSLPIGLADTLR